MKKSRFNCFIFFSKIYYLTTCFLPSFCCGQRSQPHSLFISTPELIFQLNQLYTLAFFFWGFIVPNHVAAAAVVVNIIAANRGEKALTHTGMSMNNSWQRHIVKSGQKLSLKSVWMIAEKIVEILGEFLGKASAPRPFSGRQRRT